MLKCSISSAREYECVKEKKAELFGTISSCGNQFGPMTFKACIASLLLQDFSLRFHAWCQRIPILAEAAYRLCPKPSPAPSNRCPGSKPQNKTITDSVSSRTPLNFQKEVKILVEPVAFLVA